MIADKELKKNTFHGNDIYNEIINDNSRSTDSIIIIDEELNSSSESAFYHSNTANIIMFFAKKHDENTFKYLPTFAFNNSLIKKWLTVNRIKSQITSLQETGDIEKTLDYIFDTFDDLLQRSNFDICNGFFEYVNLKDFSIHSLIGLLTITSTWKDKLPMRKSFYQQVCEIIYSNYLSEEAEQILLGLD